MENDNRTIVLHISYLKSHVTGASRPQQQDSPLDIRILKPFSQLYTSTPLLPEFIYLATYIKKGTQVTCQSCCNCEFVPIECICSDND